MNFLRMLRKIAVSYGDCIRVSFHINLTPIGIFRFFCKNLKLSRALEGFSPAPKPSYIPTISWYLGGRHVNFRKS